MVFTWIGGVFVILLIVVAAQVRKTSRQLAKPLNTGAFVVEKDGSAARGKFWMVVLYLAGLGSFGMWFGFVGMLEHYDATRPVKPDGGKGAVIAQNNHGHVVYLTEGEERLLLSLQRTSIGFFFVGAMATYFYKRATGKLPN